VRCEYHRRQAAKRRKRKSRGRNVTEVTNASVNNGSRFRGAEQDPIKHVLLQPMASKGGVVFVEIDEIHPTLTVKGAQITGFDTPVDFLKLSL